MENNIFKTAFVVAVALIGSYLQQLLLPLAVLIFMMVLDYISGMAAAWVTRTLDSRVGIVGIIKKLLYLLIVCVGCVIDYLIYLVGAEMGVARPSGHFVGLIVIVWLIVNEGISILENLGEAGLPKVPFLGKLLQHLKHGAESAGGDPPEEKEDENPDE